MYIYSEFVTHVASFFSVASPVIYEEANGPSTSNTTPSQRGRGRGRSCSCIISTWGDLTPPTRCSEQSRCPIKQVVCDHFPALPGHCSDQQLHFTQRAVCHPP